MIEVAVKVVLNETVSIIVSEIIYATQVPFYELTTTAMTTEGVTTQQTVSSCHRCDSHFTNTNLYK